MAISTILAMMSSKAPSSRSASVTDTAMIHGKSSLVLGQSICECACKINIICVNGKYMYRLFVSEQIITCSM